MRFAAGGEDGGVELGRGVWGVRGVLCVVVLLLVREGAEGFDVWAQEHVVDFVAELPWKAEEGGAVLLVYFVVC